MTLIRLTLRRIAGSPFRSILVFLCVALIAGSAVWATVVIQAAEENLRLSVWGMNNPGGDFVVVPRIDGYSSTGMGNVNLAGLLIDIVAIQGVERASPQLLLATLLESEYSSEPEVFVVAFDQATDFSLLPWLPEGTPSSIWIGEAIAGSSISVPVGGQEIDMAGYPLKLVGQLSTTGTSIDQSIYVTFQTYREMIQQNLISSSGQLALEAQSAPYILVKILPGNDAKYVSSLVLKNIRGVSVFDNEIFFQRTHDRLMSLLKSIPWLLGIGWGLMVFWIGLIFSIAVTERSREIGVLRALGSSRSFILRSLFAEGFILALGGALVGIVSSVVALAFIREGIVPSTNMLLISFSPLEVLLLALESLLVAVSSVFLAVIFPAWRISRQDPALIMRG